MKKAIVVLISLIIISLSSSAQVSVFGKLTGNTVSPCVTIFGTKKISEKFEFTYFALVNKMWGESQIGVAYSPVEGVTIGLSGGIEHHKALYRLGSFLYLGKGKISFLTLVEKGDGPDNYWYKSTLSYKATENLNVAVRAWRFTGIGPVVEYKIKKIDSKLWTMFAVDSKSHTNSLLLGIDINL